MAAGFGQEFDPGVVAPRGAGATASGSTLVVTWRGPQRRVREAVVSAAALAGAALGWWVSKRLALGDWDFVPIAVAAVGLGALTRRLIAGPSSQETQLHVEPGALTLKAPWRGPRAFERARFSGLSVDERRTQTEDEGEVVEYWLSGVLREGGLQQLIRIERHFATWIIECYAEWERRHPPPAAAPPAQEGDAPPGALALREEGALELRWPGLAMNTVCSLRLRHGTLRFHAGGALSGTTELPLKEVQDLVVIEEEARSPFRSGPTPTEHRLVVVLRAGGRKVLGAVRPECGHWAERLFEANRKAVAMRVSEPQ